MARVKVAAFGLDRFLDLAIGAYGDDDRERAELVDIARKRAEKQLGTAISVEQVVLIGNTPADVEAAMASGTRIIVIASGAYTVEDLRTAGAETTLTTLSNLPQLWRADARAELDERAPSRGRTRAECAVRDS